MSDILPDIISLKPYCREKVWGGRHLEALYSKALPPAVAIGEPFELSAYEERESTVASGECAGLALRELVAAHGAELVGAGVWDRYDGRFPLLVKLIDAQQDLSIQVHPDDATAARHHPGYRGKTEAWYILSNKPGSRLWVGLHPGTTSEQLATALETGEIDSCVDSFEVRAGQCVIVPAGTIHAIGEGIVLAEIQQSSDLTYRLHDW